MARVASLCLAILAHISLSVLPGVDAVHSLESVVPHVQYRQALRNVRQAYERVRERLLFVEPRVTDPSMHYLVVVGFVDAAAHVVFESGVDRVEILNRYLPLVYQDPVAASKRVKNDLNELRVYLMPLVDLVVDLCRNSDDKDCNMAVQLQVDRVTYLQRSVRVLEVLDHLATSYLELHEDLVAASNHFSGLGYVLNNADKLFNVASLLGDALREGRCRN